MADLFAFRFVQMRVLSALVLAATLCGCTSTHVMSLDGVDARTTINDRSLHGSAVLRIVGENARMVRHLHVAQDVTTWTDRLSGELHSAPTSDVRSVTFRRDGPGALKGAAFGAAVGAAIGLVGTASDDGRGMFTPAALTGMAGAMGAIIGAVTGTIVHPRDTYRPGEISD